MADEAQTDIREILQEMQDSREVGASHREKIGLCLRHFAAKRIPLAICCDARHLNRSMVTLERYVRELGLRFPDYVPYKLRSEEERKRKRAAP